VSVPAAPIAALSVASLAARRNPETWRSSSPRTCSGTRRRRASSRSAYHVEKGPEDRCREVTANVLAVDGDLSKTHLLTGLSGFKAPTASCALTALDPERHAVVDTRVWASLERTGYPEGRRESFDARKTTASSSAAHQNASRSGDAADSAAMVDPIREIAAETGYSAAEVRYALFGHGAHVREGTLH
jgi:hypothetical protein